MAGRSPSVIAPEAPEAPVRDAAERIVPRESTGARLRRRSHRAGLHLAALTTVVLIVVLVALTVANTRQVKLDWLLGSGTASLVWIVIASAILGGAIGVVASGVFRWRTRPPGR
jgi:uncharacterized integral membrane protein